MSIFVPHPPPPPFRFQVFKLELHRGWNSRLGFSLGAADSAPAAASQIRAIYANSVAARDGRLRIGDQILMVSAIFGSTKVVVSKHPRNHCCNDSHTSDGAVVESCRVVFVLAGSLY